MKQNFNKQQDFVDLKKRIKKKNFKTCLLIIYPEELEESHYLNRLLRETNNYQLIFDKIVVLAAKWKADLIIKSYTKRYEIIGFSPFHLTRFFANKSNRELRKNIINKTVVADIRSEALEFIQAIEEEKPLIYNELNKVEFAFVYSLLNGAQRAKVNTPEDVYFENIKMLHDKGDCDNWQSEFYSKLILERVSQKKSKNWLTIFWPGFPEALVAQEIFKYKHLLSNLTDNSSTWWQKRKQILPFIRNLSFEIYTEILSKNKCLLDNEFENYPECIKEFIHGEEKIINLIIRNEKLRILDFELISQFKKKFINKLELYNIKTECNILAMLNCESIKNHLKEFSILFSPMLIIQLDYLEHILNNSKIEYLTFHGIVLTINTNYGKLTISKLKKLFVIDCKLTDKEFKYFIDILEYSPKIEEVDFSENDLEGKKYINNSLFK